MSRLLVPLDGSADAASALAFAVGLARASSASLAALYVARPAGLLRRKRVSARAVGEFSEWGEDEGDEAQLALLPARVWGKTAGVRVDTLAARGEVAEEILAAADAQKVELIVMGTHGKSAGSGGKVLGSIARAVFTASAVPTVVVPPRAVADPDALARDVARFSEGLPIGPKVVAAVDGGPGSDAVVAEALRMARETRGSLRLFTGGPLPDGGASDALLAGGEEDARRDGVPVERDADGGEALPRLLALARSHAADLVVVGTRAKAGAMPDHFGSFTDRLLAEVSCPVDVVRLRTRAGA